MGLYFSWIFQQTPLIKVSNLEITQTKLESIVITSKVSLIKKTIQLNIGIYVNYICRFKNYKSFCFQSSPVQFAICNATKTSFIDHINTKRGGLWFCISNLNLSLKISSKATGFTQKANLDNSVRCCCIDIPITICTMVVLVIFI